MRRDELAARKAELEARIAAHRRRMMQDAREWREAVRPVDDAWHTLVRWKVPLALAGRARAIAATSAATLAARTGCSRCGTITRSCASTASARRCRPRLEASSGRCAVRTMAT